VALVFVTAMACWLVPSLTTTTAFVTRSSSSSSSSSSTVFLKEVLMATTTSCPLSSTRTWAKRRGSLEWIVNKDHDDDDDSATITTTTKTRTVPKKRSKRVANKPTKKTSSTKKDTESVSTISPLLQQWASGQPLEDDTEDDDDDDKDISTKTASTAATSFTSFDQDDDKNKKTTTLLSNKKSLQQAQDQERKEFVMSIVQQIQDVLTTSKEENKKTVDLTTAILNPLQTLMELPNANTNLRQLLAGNKRYDYRLAWVGSDKAICHVGTGLHNVPLARLQEIYLSLVGKSRVEVLEVIRILGPFPNVRNTLEGTAKIGKRNVEFNNNNNMMSMSELSVTYDSMIDGTGKQITAGVENNVRKYGLNILFCDENAIVAMVPSLSASSSSKNAPLQQETTNLDPFQDNGGSILFFAREENLDENLEKMRVL
jgi:hypothetical protein